MWADYHILINHFGRNEYMKEGIKMEIFLSAEIEGPATSKWFVLQKEFSLLLSVLHKKDYGEQLNSIGIISIIMRDEYFEDGGHKERKYYSKTRKEADIRLRINYNDFLRANEADRKKLYIAHILDSIYIAGKKAGKDFAVTQLLTDVETILKYGRNIV